MIVFKFSNWYRHTWVGWLNMLVLQWLGLRLGYSIDLRSKKIVCWELLYLVVPLTGWQSSYIPEFPRSVRLWTRSK